MKKILSILIFATLCAGCNISCFGDSNTAVSWPPVGGPYTKWVQMLDMTVPLNWSTVEHGVPARRLVDVATTAGLAELDSQIVADNAVYIVLAYGEADAIEISFGRETVNEANQALDDILVHLDLTFPVRIVFVALVPPGFGSKTVINPFVGQINAHIVSVVAFNRLIDFADIALAEDTWDGVHFCGDPPIAPCTTAHGQQARADAALAVLFP